MIVPQGMSYANIAGVPSVYGLYGSFLPLMVYALLGSSRQLGVGPVAVTSLLIGSGIKNMLPGAENIDNPNAPAPQYAELQAEYNHKVSCMMMLQTTSLGCCEFPVFKALSPLKLWFCTALLGARLAHRLQEYCCRQCRQHMLLPRATAVAGPQGPEGCATAISLHS